MYCTIGHPYKHIVTSCFQVPRRLVSTVGARESILHTAKEKDKEST